MRRKQMSPVHETMLFKVILVVLISPLGSTAFMTQSTTTSFSDVPSQPQVLPTEEIGAMPTKQGSKKRNALAIRYLSGGFAEKESSRSLSSEMSRFLAPTLKQYRMIQTYLLPPVPKQENINLQFRDYFRPKFVARETLLGVRLMMRIFCFLVVAGWIFQSMIPMLPALETASQNQLHTFTGIHVIESYTKGVVMKGLQIPSIDVWYGFLLRLAIVVPILEEVFYRGFGLAASYWNKWLFLQCWAWLLAFAPILVSTLGGLTLIRGLISAAGAATTVPPLKLARLVVDSSLSWITLPLQWQMMQVARQSQVVSHNDELPPDTSATKCLALPVTKGNERHRSIVTRLVRRGHAAANASNEVRLEDRIQCTLEHSSRWASSAFFASAHVPFQLASTTVALFSSESQYLYLRKFIGVFVSSWLMESRLAVNRQVLWGAMGAHMTFNILTAFRVVLETGLSTLVSRQILPEPILLGGILIGVVFCCQTLLDAIGRKIKAMEDILLQKTT